MVVLQHSAAGFMGRTDLGAVNEWSGEGGAVIEMPPHLKIAISLKLQKRGNYFLSPPPHTLYNPVDGPDWTPPWCSGGIWRLIWSQERAFRAGHRPAISRRDAGYASNNPIKGPREEYHRQAVSRLGNMLANVIILLFFKRIFIILPPLTRLLNSIWNGFTYIVNMYRITKRVLKGYFWSWTYFYRASHGLQLWHLFKFCHKIYVPY